MKDLNTACLMSSFSEIQKKKIISVVELHDSEMTLALIEKLKNVGLNYNLFSTSKITTEYKIRIRKS